MPTQFTEVGQRSYASRFELRIIMATSKQDLLSLWVDLNSKAIETMVVHMVWE